MQRITIREAVPRDAEEIVAHMERISREPNNNVLTGPGEYTVTPAEEREIIDGYAASDNSIALVAVADGKIIGLLHCRGGRRQAARHSASFGITVHADWRDKGVGSALVQRLIDWGRQNPVIKRLELEVFTTNARAIHVYEKYGFQIEGRKRRAYCKDGAYEDAYIMALLLEE